MIYYFTGVDVFVVAPTGMGKVSKHLHPWSHMLKSLSRVSVSKYQPQPKR